MPDSLAANFPQEERDAAAERLLHIGAVIRSKFPEIGKVKRYIIVAQCIFDESDYGVVVINTLPTPIPALKHLDIPILKTDCTFIDYDCFVDCSWLFTMRKSTLTKILTNEPESHLGEISGDLHDAIKDAIRAAKVINRCGFPLAADASVSALTVYISLYQNKRISFSMPCSVPDLASKVIFSILLFIE